MTEWIEIKSEADHHVALELARGSYQRALLQGRENLSGSTLKGKASSYGAHYKRSRENLLSRMTQAGVNWSERKGPHGARILVIG